MQHKLFHRFVSFILALAISIVGFAPALAAPPNNDNFADAEVINSLPFNVTVDITDTGIEPDENQFLCTNVEHSVWYTFTPQENMTVQINMQGSAVTTALGAIYHADNPGITGLSVRGCAYSSNPPVNVQLNANEIYYLQVSSYTAEVGTIQVNLEQIPTPTNDLFTNAEQIDAVPFSATIDLTAAMIESNEPQPCYSMSRSVWYSFTPSQDMVVRADTQGSTFYNTNVNVYHSIGSEITDMEYLSCSVFSGGAATFTVAAGQTYYLQAGNTFGDVGTIQINLQQLLPPSNDNFADAEVVSALPFSTTVDMAVAGLETDEPQPCSNWGKSVWYSFIPPETMRIRVTTTFNVNVYKSSGPGFEDLTFQDCTYIGQGFVAEAGQKYYFQAEGVGNIQINLEQLIPPANDNFADAEVITSLPFSTTVNITDAGIEAGEPLACPYSQRTAWYSFTPTENTSIRVTNNYNLTVYRANGPGLANLVYQGCNNNNGYVNFFAEANQTYYLQVDGFGSINIDLEQLHPPSNDAFVAAQSITALPFSETVDVTDALTEFSEPQNCYPMPNTVWYSFTPTVNTLVRANTQGSAINSNLNVYKLYGSGISNLTYLGCTYYSGPITFLAEAGQTYYLQAGGIYGEVGTIQVNLEQLPFPANDDFANAITATSPLPFDNTIDTQYSTRQTGEPTPSCAYYGPGTRSVWYAFTPTTSGSFSAGIPSAMFTPVLAVYTGSSLTNLSQIGCQPYGSLLTFHANAGTTYYFQVSNLYPWDQGGSMQFHLDVTPPPQASFYYYPGDPSKYDTVQFQDNSYDPGNMGFQTYTWNFGDGATANGYSTTHKYAADGSYQVTHTVTTVDGRTASVTQTVQVRTHDVAITKLATPNSANAGQTKTITVTLRNTAYPETVQIDLYKSTANGFVWVGTVTKSVPVLSGNKTTAVDFSYTFTSDDAKLGKLTFKAVATIVGARDAYPSDNEAISSIIKVAK